MKKAYVKPVFLAEEFEGTESVAACGYHVGEPGNHLQVYNGLHLCSGNCSHVIGKKQNNPEGTVQEYWDYATDTPYATDAPRSEDYGTYNDGAFLFTGGQVVCDFVWNGGSSQVGIWTKDENAPESAISNATSRNPLKSFITLLGSFSSFFAVPAEDDKNHRPGVDGKSFFS